MKDIRHHKELNIIGTPHLPHLGISLRSVPGNIKQWYIRIKLKEDNSSDPLYAYFPLIYAQLSLYLEGSITLSELIPDCLAFHSSVQDYYSAFSEGEKGINFDTLVNNLNTATDEDPRLGTIANSEGNIAAAFYYESTLYLGVLFKGVRGYAYIPVSLQSMEKYLHGQLTLCDIFPAKKDYEHASKLYNEIASDLILNEPDEVLRQLTIGPPIRTEFNPFGLRAVYNSRVREDWQYEGRPLLSYVGWMEDGIHKVYSILKEALCPYCGGSGTIQGDGYKEECEWCYDQSNIIEILNE